MSVLTAQPTDRGASWETVQAELADLPGEGGIERRREAYAPFFLRLGRDVRIAEGCRFTHPGRIVLDDDVRINNGALVYGSGGVRIGRHARLGPWLFIHSANHDVAPGPRAFFERGYEFASVEIGDNCLLSARVSILPGARLAAGTFVACGAVVTRDRYPDAARIMGVPGTVRVEPEGAAAPPATPSIALVAPATGGWRAAAELLAASLGLPQVAVCAEGAALPPSVHDVVAVGPPGWQPAPGPGAPGARTWRLADGTALPAGAVRLDAPGGAVALPAERRHVLVPVDDAASSPAENTCALSLYYALKRLRKRGALEPAERRDLYAALWSLRATPGPPCPDVADELADLLPAPADDMTPEERGALSALRGEPGGRGGRDDAAAVAGAVFALATASEPVRAAGCAGRVEAWTAETYRQCPELATAVALATPDHARAVLPGHLATILPKATKATALAHYGLAAHAVGEAEAVRHCRDRLLSDDFRDAATACVRARPDRAALCYSPAVAVFLLLAAARDDPDFRPRRPRAVTEPLRWLALDAEAAPWTVEVAGRRGALVDPDRRLISRSLLDNWRLGLGVPAFEGMQYELLAPSYEPIAPALDEVWASIFRAMQHAAGEPLVRVRPWPFGRRAALSLRYDVDRPTTAEQVERIAAIQAAGLNAACGSWYLIPGTPFGSRAGDLASRFLQETGVHATSPDADGRGLGVTCHSAAGSDYWRGRLTVEAQEAGGADHGEMLAAQLGRPRPGWLGDVADGRPTACWLTPIHFPLEGSTTDEDLSYFDERIDRFRALLAAGGHAIVGSHPDLDQSLLEQLLAREDLSGAWCAPVGMVVDRCRALLAPGAVRVVGSGPDGVDLLAARTVADVHVEIDAPGAAAPRAVCVQLGAGAPRRVAWT